MKLAGWVLGRTGLYRWAGWLARKTIGRLPRWMVYNRFNAWGKQRELPPMPARSFRELYAERKR
jgi:L-lactate dehydrogenase complex protein LldF